MGACGEGRWVVLHGSGLAVCPRALTTAGITPQTLLRHRNRTNPPANMHTAQKSTPQVYRTVYVTANRPRAHRCRIPNHRSRLLISGDTDLVVDLCSYMGLVPGGEHELGVLGLAARTT